MLERFYSSKMGNKHIWILYVLSILVICVLFYFQKIISIVFAILFIVTFYFVNREEKNILNKQKDYITTLSYQVENAGEEIFFSIPIGIIIYNEHYNIEWVNPYIAELDGEEAILNKSLDVYSEELIPAIKSEKDEIWLTINHLHYKTKID